MKELPTLIILYVSTVFGFQHYDWVRSTILQPRFPNMNTQVLDVCSVLLSTFVFMTLAGTIGALIYKNRIASSNVCSGCLLKVVLSPVAIWYSSIFVLKLLEHVNIALVNWIVNTEGVRVIKTTEPIFNSLVQIWITQPHQGVFFH